jgi:TrpR-related protein YerC/YecD
MKNKLNNDIKSLYEAILVLKTEDECRKFFRDLLTEAEIKEFSNRWKVARMLNKKVPYEIIEKETGMSSTTIARISKWLNKGMDGYKLILFRLNNNHRTVLKAV